MKDNEVACIPHAASFLCLFSSMGGVHLVHRLFFGESVPPSCEINDEAACIPHAASFSR